MRLDTEEADVAVGAWDVVSSGTGGRADDVGASAWNWTCGTGGTRAVGRGGGAACSCSCAAGGGVGGGVGVEGVVDVGWAGGVPPVELVTFKQTLLKQHGELC